MRLLCSKHMYQIGNLVSHHLDNEYSDIEINVQAMPGDITQSEKEPKYMLTLVVTSLDRVYVFLESMQKAMSLLSRGTESIRPDSPYMPKPSAETHISDGILAQYGQGFAIVLCKWTLTTNFASI